MSKYNMPSSGQPSSVVVVPVHCGCPILLQLMGISRTPISLDPGPLASSAQPITAQLWPQVSKVDLLRHTS